MASETIKIWVTVHPKTAGQIRAHFMDQLLSYEENLPIDQRVLLNETATDAGLVIATQKQWFDENEYYVHVLVMVAARPVIERETFVLTGVLAVDPDRDLSGVLLQIIGPDELTQYLFIGRNYEFSVELVPGAYRLSGVDTQTPLVIIPEVWITVTDQNVFVMPEVQDTETILNP